jgi:hypothetical protein
MMSLDIRVHCALFSAFDVIMGAIGNTKSPNLWSQFKKLAVEANLDDRGEPVVDWLDAVIGES